MEDPAVQWEGTISILQGVVNRWSSLRKNPLILGCRPYHRDSRTSSAYCDNVVRTKPDGCESPPTERPGNVGANRPNERDLQPRFRKPVGRIRANAAQPERNTSCLSLFVSNRKSRTETNYIEIDASDHQYRFCHS